MTEIDLESLRRIFDNKIAALKADYDKLCAVDGLVGSEITVATKNHIMDTIFILQDTHHEIMMSIMMFFLFGVGTNLLISWLIFRRYKTPDSLGVLMVKCRRSKYFFWLVWNVWGDSSWYLDHLEEKIEKYRALQRRFLS